MDDHAILKGAGAVLTILLGLLTYFFKRLVDQTDETKAEHARKILAATERLDDHGKKIVMLEAVRDLPLKQVEVVASDLDSLAGEVRRELRVLSERASGLDGAVVRLNTQREHALADLLQRIAGVHQEVDSLADRLSVDDFAARAARFAALIEQVAGLQREVDRLRAR